MSKTKIVLLSALLLVAVGAAVWYYTRRNKLTAMRGSGNTWDAADAALYEQMRSVFKAESGQPNALGSWLDAIVKENYTTNQASIIPEHRLNGVVTKSGTFLATFEMVNANEKGLHEHNGVKNLWPESLHLKLLEMYAAFKTQYGGL